MRILILSPDFPLPTSNATRHKIYHLVRSLAPRHQVHLMTFHQPDRIPSARGVEQLLGLGCQTVFTCSWAREPFVRDLVLGAFDPMPHAYRKYRSSLFCAHLQQSVRQQEFDVVHCDINMTEMHRYLSGNEATIVSPSDSFTKLQWRSIQHVGGIINKAYTLMQLAKFYVAERKLYPKYTKCHVVSKPEADYLLRINPKIDTAIVPIGAAVPERFVSEDERQPSCDIVFSGQMSNPFTVNSILWFHRKVWPLIRSQMYSCRLWLVGSDPTLEISTLSALDNSVVVTGYVDDIGAELRQKKVYICPLIYGVGIKTRILEAMANSMPVVTTTIGAEGIEIVDGKHALIADSPAAFADSVIRLLRSPEMRQELARAGYDLVKSHYTWDAYSKGMECLYVEAVCKQSKLRD